MSLTSTVRYLTIAALCISLSVGCKKKPADASDSGTQTDVAQDNQGNADTADDSATDEDAEDAEQADEEKPADDADEEALNSEDPNEILQSIEGEGDLHATFITNQGEIHCELYEEKAPNTVANFVGLATGKKRFVDPNDGETKQEPFYDGTIFHRVIPSFMIQGGDRLGQGMGGPGYRFEDEFHADLRHDSAGILSMANSGPNTNGSQFFITDAPTPHLDNRHSVFGKCENLDVVSKIASVDRARGDRPIEEVVIERIEISRK